ncbi:zinc dependent phospholipase C family protein [Rubrobacter taiwanensis]|uniref:zinc dependent phospholipase C family protein n=1 Tax=Rubrobacter taiwanensis TaxID=185139 RepID=UPI001405427B|nr:zinc dependent phospholipase C family protein [Rubrobacter taiwanensis]
MRTYSHAILAWTLARRGGGTVSAAAALGAVLPDLPALVKAAALWPRRRSMTRREFCERLYTGGASAKLDAALHSFFPATLALALSPALKPQTRRVVRSFALGWLSHNASDLLTHAEHARPQLWPLSDFRWQSPVSYRSPEHHGTAFTAAEHAVLLAALARALSSRRSAGT